MVSRTAPENLYNGLMGAYHYLGYGQGTGEQLKYVISLESRPLAAIGFSAAAWRVACRDHFIGWNDQVRQKKSRRSVFTVPPRRDYRAANWIAVGETVGRGRNDRIPPSGLPLKQVYLYPLDPNFRQRLGELTSSRCQMI